MMGYLLAMSESTDNSKMLSEKENPRKLYIVQYPFCNIQKQAKEK